ncbi:MAG: methionine--tRNA ligase subunit beta [Candidatus Omnitrophota bacterium]
MEDISKGQAAGPDPILPEVPPAVAPVPQPVTPPAKPVLTLDDFKKVELRVAQIKDVAEHPNADKLYVLTVDAGNTTKQIVAGIKRGYTKEELVGKFVVLVNNLAPAILRGVESQGMLLAASDQDSIAVVSPDKPMKPGSAVK